MVRFVVGVDSPIIPENCVLAGLEWLLPRIGELTVRVCRPRKMTKFSEAAVYERAESIITTLKDAGADVLVGVASAPVPYTGKTTLMCRTDVAILVHATGMIEKRLLNPRQVTHQSRREGSMEFSMETVWSLKTLISHHCRILCRRHRKLESP